MNWQEELLEAIALKNFERAKTALENGAEINARIDSEYPVKGTTALYWAAVADREDPGVPRADRIRWTLQAGGRVAAESPDDGFTSMHVASEAGNVEALKLLLDADGAVALSRFDYLSRTPLICAVHKGHVEATRLLLASGADVNAHDEARIGETALSRAVEEGHRALVRVLLQAGANPRLKGWMQLSPLERAEPWRTSDDAELRHLHAELEEASARHNLH